MKRRTKKISPYRQPAWAPLTRLGRAGSWGRGRAGSWRALAACLLLVLAMTQGAAHLLAGERHATAKAEPVSHQVEKIPAAFQVPAEKSSSGEDHVRFTSGMLAIVIDDIGHNLERLQELLALDATLNYAVLPDIPKADQAARMIQDAGQEYLIHLPMEPEDYPNKNPGPYPLLLSLGLTETRNRLGQYLERLPGAVGASNHMGSAYSANPIHMKLVQDMLARRGKFFLNSKTAPTTVPRKIAGHYQYDYLERDVFLDHDPSKASIARQLAVSIRKAKRTGQAIAIGHPYDSTLYVLRKYLPRLKAAGITLVTLSTLVGR